jgi:2-oxoglutarate dehydrogenase E2 component (dihydrolipoamide succinyltransferase)
MTIEVTMPQLGETVAEGTVTRWLRQVGQTVNDQEPLVEIATDKVDAEIPSPASGTLLEIRVSENATVAVGTVIAVIGEPHPTAPAATPGRPPRHHHSPLVRRLAREAGLDLDSLVATGPGGRATRADVARAMAERTAPSPAPVALVVPPPPTVVAEQAAPVDSAERREPMSRLRSIVAERMMTSLATSAQLTCVMEVDLSGIVRLRRAERATDDAPPSLTAFFVEAVVQALRAYPLLNASIDGDGRTIVHRGRHNIGIAVDTAKGLVVPVIRDAGDLSLRGLSRRIADLADRARSGTLTPDDLSAGTFTVTNTGSRGALFDTPILVPGQVGILGIGAVVERPVVVRRSTGEPAIAIRDMAHLALTYDHRLIDGADAARFLMFIKQRLEIERADVEAW